MSRNLMAVQGEAARLTVDHGFGIAVPPCDPAAMALAVLKFSQTAPAERRTLEVAAEKAYRTKFCAAVQVAKLERLLVSCAYGKVPSDAMSTQTDPNARPRRAA